MPEAAPVTTATLPVLVVIMTPLVSPAAAQRSP